MTARGSDRLQPAMMVFLAVFLGLGLIAYAGFGFMGVGRGDSSYAFDLRYFWTAGEVWERLQSPYDDAAFGAAMTEIDYPDAGAYAYPPSSSLFGMALSSQPLGGGGRLMGALNILSLAVMLAYLHMAARQSPALWQGPVDERANLVALVLTAGVVIGNPFAAHVTWMGQTTLLSGAFLLVSWDQARRGNDLLAGLFLALGAFKPQLAFLIVIWFLIDRRWLLLLASAVGTLIVSGWPIWATGITGSWLGWLEALRSYQGEGSNVMTFKHVFGLRSTLASLGLPAPTLMPLGIAATVLLYLRQRDYDQVWLVAVLFALSFLFVYAHDYDVSVAVILLYPLLIAVRGRPGLVILLCLLGAMLFFPSRIWEKLDLTEMARTRELALLALTVMYLILCRRRSAG